ncbi:MAG: hypothetical protein AAF682_17070 [Planctomycetota bacterium]
MHAVTLLLTLPLLVQEPDSPPATPDVLKKVAVVGASVSAGFGLEREAERSLDLAQVLGAVTRVETTPARSEASNFLFLDPKGSGTEMVDKIVAEEPTLLVATDFLFWFGYGSMNTEKGRLARFEAGLALLDRFPCPIVVGDLPNMSPSLESEAPMLGASQIPDEAVLAKLNARLAAWAAERSRVHVMPLANFVYRVFEGERVELRGNVWEDDIDALMQIDLLHPTLEGTLGMTLLAMDTLVRGHEDVTAEMFRWDISAVREELLPKEDAAPTGGGR